MREVSYDARGLPIESRSGLGTGALVAPIVERWTYDAERRQRTRTDGRGHTWESLYDGFGRVRESRDPLGHPRRVSYDDGHEAVSSRAFDAAGTLLAESTTEVDLLGRRTAAHRWLWSGEAAGGDRPAGARGLSSRFVWDAASNLLSSEDALGRLTQRRYDAAERLVEVEDAVGNRREFGLDAAGNAVEVRSVERDPQGNVTTVSTRASFDALGRPISSSDALGNTTQSVYGARGLLLRRIDPEGYFTVWEHDGLSRKVREIQPEGIQVDYVYDRKSRLTSYRDALGNTTDWTYDAVDRRTRVCYPDGFCESFSYDAAHNPTTHVDQRGTTVSTTFDAANRPTARTITPADGESLEGPLAETYQYDGLHRLTRAQSGSVVSELSYDSLSRRLSDTTAGRTVSYQLDDVGNATSTLYPSAHQVARSFDGLDRTAQVSAGAQTLASFGYRGPDLVIERSLGSLTGIQSFDAAKRPIRTTLRPPSGPPVFDESVGWTPRNLKLALTRHDLGRAGRAFAYDGAQRLAAASREGDPLASLPNNSAPDTASLESRPEAERFVFDTAQNMTGRTEVIDGIPRTTELPPDGSGRNRPASVGGQALEWDANGNLTAKDDRRFHYDYRNRLTRITDAGGQEIARYTYDAFNRRIRQEVAGEVRETVWDGWRSIEDYSDGQLAGRRTYGLGLDEAVRLEGDLDGDGDLEAALVPIYDSTGNLAAVTDAGGKPIERYHYSAFGEQTILADVTPPEVEQVRTQGGELWLEVSEAVLLSELEAALASGEASLTLDATGAVLELSASQPIESGRQARQRQVLTLTTPPAVGEAVTLTLPPSALVDPFHNQPATPFEVTFAWPAGDIVIQDAAAPRVEMVRLRDATLEIELSETPELTAAQTAVTVDGQAATWTLSEDGYTLLGTERLSTAPHEVAIGTVGLDLVGQGLTEAFSATVAIGAGSEDQIVYRAPLAQEVEASTVGNRYGFHGLPRDAESGLLYVRNRYYDPEMGRFITADPLGFVDGPSMYAFAGYSPVDFRDPRGLYIVAGQKELEYLRSVLRNVGLNEHASALRLDTVTVPRENRSLLSEMGRWITDEKAPTEQRIVNGGAVWEARYGSGAAQEIAAMIDFLIDDDTRVEVSVGPSDEARSAGGGIMYPEYRPVAIMIKIDPSAVRAMVPAQFSDGSIGKVAIGSLELALVHELGHAYSKVTGSSSYLARDFFDGIYYENLYRESTAKNPGQQAIRVRELSPVGDPTFEMKDYEKRVMDFMIGRFRRGASR